MSEQKKYRLIIVQYVSADFRMIKLIEIGKIDNEICSTFRRMCNIKNLETWINMS